MLWDFSTARQRSCVSIDAFAASSQVVQLASRVCGHTGMPELKGFVQFRELVMFLLRILHYSFYTSVLSVALCTFRPQLLTAILEMQEQESMCGD